MEILLSCAFFVWLYQMLYWLHVIKVIQFAKLNGNLVYKEVDSTTLTATELSSSNADLCSNASAFTSALLHLSGTT